MSSGRHVIVGDVHGQRATLRRLLDEVALEPRDTLVLVGDLVDRGADSAGVVRDLHALSRSQPVVLVKGNHEAKHARYRLRKRHDPRQAAQMSSAAEIEAVTAELADEDLAWLDASVLWARIPEHEALVVHAGLPPLMSRLVGDPADAPTRRPAAAVAAGLPRTGPSDLTALSSAERPWAEQMLRVRWVRRATRLELVVEASRELAEGDDGPLHGAEVTVTGRVQRRRLLPRGTFLALGEQQPGDPYWADLYDGRWGHVYFGHNPFSDRTEPPRWEHATALDLGAVYGNRLAAAVLEPGREPAFATMPAEG